MAVSRFKSKERCFLYGTLRQTDFSPVGEGTESEITERGVLSGSADSEEEFIENVCGSSDPYYSVDDIVFAHNPDFEP